MEEKINKREHFRVRIDNKICGTCSIVKVRGVEIEPKTIHVCIKDISAGGLRLLTTYDLPANAFIDYKYGFYMGDVEWSLIGHIVRKVLDSDGTFTYGIKFSISDSVKSDLHFTIGRLGVLIRKKSKITSCKFCQILENCPNRAVK